MITETYKGRKIKVSKNRDRGCLHVLVNGELTASPLGYSQQTIDAALASTRATIDYIDQDPVPDGGAWGAHWYAPGTYEMCGDGTHPMVIGGPCRHPYCQEKARADR